VKRPPKKKNGGKRDRSRKTNHYGRGTRRNYGPGKKKVTYACSGSNLNWSDVKGGEKKAKDYEKTGRVKKKKAAHGFTSNAKKMKERRVGRKRGNEMGTLPGYRN